MPSMTQRLPADLHSVGQARWAVRSALIEWGRDDVADDAAQVVTELATNAVLHAGTPFVVMVAAEEDAVRVAVADGSRMRPVLRRGLAQATTGRGVTLVAELSTAWGVEDMPEGKTVWCLLRGAIPDASGGAGTRRSSRRPAAEHRALGPLGRSGGERPRRSRSRGRPVTAATDASRSVGAGLTVATCLPVATGQPVNVPAVA